jgi:hypothetical protein
MQNATLRSAIQAVSALFATCSSTLLASWPLLRRLPTRLSDLSPEVLDLVGRAVDAGIARLVLDDDGRAVVRLARP